MKQRIILSWSTGKDSAWSLHVLRQNPNVEVIGLLTTINTTHQRVAMHSTRLVLAEAQAHAVGLPLRFIPLPWPCSNDVYEREMRGAVDDALERGATHIAFGDLFLADIRAYRTDSLKVLAFSRYFPSGINPPTPLLTA